MRMVYDTWINAESSPLDADSRVFPPSDLPPAETDEAMSFLEQRKAGTLAKVFAETSSDQSSDAKLEMQGTFNNIIERRA